MGSCSACFKEPMSFVGLFRLIVRSQTPCVVVGNARSRTYKAAPCFKQKNGKGRLLSKYHLNFYDSEKRCFYGGLSSYYTSLRYFLFVPVCSMVCVPKAIFTVTLPILKIDGYLASIVQTAIGLTTVHRNYTYCICIIGSRPEARIVLPRLWRFAYGTELLDGVSLLCTSRCL